MLNVDTPTYFDAAQRVIVIGDVHGDLARLTECFYATGVLNKNTEWTAYPPNTVVVQLGDQVDSRNRGSNDDWERVPDTEVMLFMDRIDNLARLKGGRVISLIGNHEIMNVLGDFTYVSDNSGRDLSLRKQRFEPGGPFAKVLAKRCVVAKVGSLMFVHGGILPMHLMLVDGNLHRMNEIVRKFLRGETMEMHDKTLLHDVVVGDRGILWTRAYMDIVNNMESMQEVLSYVLGNTGCKLVCVGHNTVSAITGVSGGRLWLVDTGLSRAYGNESFQVLEILNDGEEFKIVEIKN